jgi:hypothetical protein
MTATFNCNARPALRWLVLLVIALVAACDDANFGNPRHVTESTGVEYAWTCRSDGCEATNDSEPVVTCDGVVSNGVGYVRSRFVKLCSTLPLGAVGWATFPESCRLVACERNAECPRWDDATYVCENGLCQKEGHDDVLRGSDMIALCLADEPRPADCADVEDDPIYVEASARVASACGDSAGICTSVPDGCRVP